MSNSEQTHWTGISIYIYKCKIFKWNMWKASNSFHKTSGRDGGVYGVFQYSLWFC